MHLATQFYDKIIEKNHGLLEENGYTTTGLNIDRQLVRLAALLHDIGHGPFSHGSEDLFPIKSGKKHYRHEDYSSVIIRDMLGETIENHEINKQNYHIRAEEIAALIEGNVNILENRIFWRILISSQLDADRCDYLLRDSYHIGVKYGHYDIDRLINTISLGVDTEDNLIPVVEKGGQHTAESIVLARYFMHVQIYFHKTRRAYDHHLRNALSSTIGKFPPPTEIGKFLEMDDYSIGNLIAQKKIENEDCRKIFTRNHDRVIYEYDRNSLENPDEVLGRYERLKKELNDKGIRCWEDSIDKDWYDSDEAKKEIFIKTETGDIIPLSSVSIPVRNIRDLMILRLYTDHDKREDCKKIITDVF